MSTRGPGHRSARHDSICRICGCAFLAKTPARDVCYTDRCERARGQQSRALRDADRVVVVDASGDPPERALSLLQPWAWLVTELAHTTYAKTIENRGWSSCSYRGPLAIHASKGVGSRDDFDSACETILAELRGTEHAARFLAEVAVEGRDRDGPIYLPRPSLARGGIVGTALVTGVCYAQATAGGGLFGPRTGGMVRALSATRDMTREEARWWTGGFGLLLAAARPVPFVPCRGALGLWRVPDEVRRAMSAGAASGGHDAG